MARLEERPIRLIVRDELDRSRLTVFVRIVLAIPLFVWVTLRGVAAFVVAFVNWLAVLIQGEVPASTHDFVASYVRYATQVSAYVFLAANPYPWFRVQQDYPVDLEIDSPVRQGRWGGFFRLALAIPALMLASALGGSFATGSSSGGSWSATSSDEGLGWSASSFGGAAAAAAFLAWFAIVAQGRAPRGLRDLVAFTLDYGAQTGGYVFLLTPRYPTSDPARADSYAKLPEHPIRLVVTDDLERPRLTTFFRLLLAIPHFIWWTLWAFLAFFAVVAAWFAALVVGRVPTPLHRFLAAFVRYSTHLGAFVLLVGRRFPGFTGREGSYAIDLAIAPRASQRRVKTLFRLVLAIPALILASALNGVAVIVALLAWWYALVTARMPEGLRNLGASCLRYAAQSYAYALLVTDHYSYASPVLHERPPEPVTAFEPAPFVGDAF